MYLAVHRSNSHNLADRAAAAMNLGGECYPASGTEGLSEICSAVTADPCDSVAFGTVSRDSLSDFGGGECSLSATGTGLSEIGVAVVAASDNSTSVAARSHDIAMAVAAS